MKKTLLAFCFAWLACLSFAQKNSNPNQSKVPAATVQSQANETAIQPDSASVKSSYTDQQTGLTFTNLQQVYKGIRVYNAVQTKVLKAGILLSLSSTFIQGMNVKAPDENPSLSSAEAFTKAALYLGLPAPANTIQVENRFAAEKKEIYSPSGIAKQNILAELIWVAGADSSIHLAWNISIDVLGSPDYWNVRIDAHTGIEISRNNYTLYDNFNKPATEAVHHTKQIVRNLSFIPSVTNVFSPQPFSPPPVITSASYNVVPFPLESRFTGNIGISTDPWKKAGATNNATTYGWHFDGTNTYNYTRGNNVYAYDDSLNLNLPGRSDTPVVTGTTLSFNNTPDFTKQPWAVTNRRFATDNLFYWNNLMHDVFYQYGFTETAGNFQNDNIGRGPLGTAGANGTDAVHAEAQDGSGTDNANFNTPPDGQSGRMQMYLFTAANNTLLNISAPASLARGYTSVEGAFSTANKLTTTPVTGALVLYKDDNTGAVNLACNAPVNNITGKIAVIYRGGSALCAPFTNKVKNAQNAGAIAVIVIDNITEQPIAMGGTDNTITIPAVMITAADGVLIASALNNNQTVTASLSIPIKFDGDIDNGVITHEYTHGISNRLTGGLAGNASCLANYEQGGEGWSDYVALMMTTDWSTAKTTDGSIARNIGTYVTGQTPGGRGIRTYPYTTDMTINPHTYSDVARSAEFPQTDNNGHAIPNATEVHYIGEVWCSVIWDMTWNIIQQEGSVNTDIYDVAGGGGNVKALNIVIMGLKLQPCSPGFLDARDAILKADSILYGLAHKCAIWSAFARRGMGYSAVQGSSNSTTDQTAKFDVPHFVISNINVSGVPLGGICAGSNLTFTTTIANGGTLPLYQWTKNGANIFEAGANSATFTTNKLNNNDTIRCILITNIGCAVSTTVTSTPSIIPVNAIPVLSVTPAGPFTFCAGDSITLTSNISTSNQWYKNASLITGSVNTVFIAKTSGVYTDSVTGTNGCKAAKNITVTVNALPVVPTVSTGTLSTTFCKGDSLVLTSSSTDANQWYKNGAVVPGATAVMFTASTTGIYMDTVTNTSGCKAVSLPLTVVVNAVPAVPVIAAVSRTVFCKGDSIVLSSDAVSAVQWYRDTLAIANAVSSKDTVKTSGSYKVRSTNSSGCFSFSSPVAITVNPLPSAIITSSGSDTFCVGKNVILTAANATGYLFQWIKDAAAIANATTRSYTADSTASYTVAVTDSNGCKAVSQAAAVKVNPLPAVPVITAGGAIIFCADKNVVLGSSASTGNQWYKDATLITGAVNTNYTASLAGNYSVIVTSAAGCTSASTNTSVATLPLPPAPTVTASGALSFCNGGSVVFTSSAGTSYQWYKDSVAISGATGAAYTTGTAGKYFVQAGAANGCNAVSVVSTVSVTVVPTPVIVQKSDTLLSSAASGNQWYLNSTLLSGAVNQKYKILNTGSYTVQVTDAGGCISALSAPLAVVITAVANVTLNSKDWIIFPNPVTTGLLIIRKNGVLNGAATAHIISSDGRVVAEKNIGANTEWNVGFMSNGNYYLRITEKKAVSVYPFIKQ